MNTDRHLKFKYLLSAFSVICYLPSEVVTVTHPATMLCGHPEIPNRFILLLRIGESAKTKRSENDSSLMTRMILSFHVIRP